MGRSGGNVSLIPWSPRFPGIDNWVSPALLAEIGSHALIIPQIRLQYAFDGLLVFPQKVLLKTTPS
jgi:hypothetical protein